MKLIRKIKLDERGNKLDCILFTCILSYLYKKDGRNIRGYKNCL